MDTIDFDLASLKLLGNIDSAVKHFNSYEEYFIALYKLAKDSEHYLSKYTADVIIGFADKCEDFRAELKKIRSELISLGITTDILSALKELEYESRMKDKKTLTDAIEKFHTEMKKTRECILSAKISDKNDPAKIADKDAASKDHLSKAEKPLILAVDDKPELLAVVTSMLTDSFKVMAVTSGQTVLQVIQKYSPELFLLDIEMPQMDGYELAEAIRRHKNFKETPIIFLTGKNTKADVIAAIRRGGNDYLVKPVNKDLLHNKILKHLDRT